MCFTSYQKDLQLAAELGKTLLERNKELETSLRQHQNIIEDQTQEIEYLTKQTAALREVNDSRLRIYEQLEVSILDLERANQRLTLDSAADKKHIKTLCVNIDSLEARCEELQKQTDELQRQLDKKSSGPNNNNNNTVNKSDGFVEAPTLEEEVDRLRGEVQELKAQKLRDQRRSTKLEEQVQALVQENQMMEEQLTTFQQKEEDMKSSLQEEMNTLEEIRSGQLCGRCSQKMDARSPFYESLQLLEHSAGGPVEDGDDEDVSVVDAFVHDSQRASVLLQLQEHSGESPYQPASENPFQRSSENPYRVLCQKYEELRQIQSNPVPTRRLSKSNPIPPSNSVPIVLPAVPTAAAHCLSLQEELQMSGDFNSFRNEDEESGNEDNALSQKSNRNIQQDSSKKTVIQSKTFSTTPTDFSEAETSSSGFSDETSTKSTQTESHRLPGSFLCTIVDGEDCRFSIYDSASPVDGRFRNTPEYRSLFREIFDILKKAAEAKEEGEKLPLLDDITVPNDPPRVPPVTPAKEDLPLLKMLAQDGTQTSIISEEASEICSEICSELTADAEVERVTAIMEEELALTPGSQKNTGEEVAGAGQTFSPAVASASTSGLNADYETKKSGKHAGDICQEPKPASPAPKRDIMEYLAMGVGRKKNRSRKNSPHGSPRKGIERIDPTNVPLVGVNSRVSYGTGGPRRRRDRYAESPQRYSESPSRQSESPSRQGGHSRSSSGHRNASSLAARCRREADEYTPQASSSRSHNLSQPQLPLNFNTNSSASQEIARLKKLEMSYADVLRKRPTLSQCMVNKCTQVGPRKSYK